MIGARRRAWSAGPKLKMGAGDETKQIQGTSSYYEYAYKVVKFQLILGRRCGDKHVLNAVTRYSATRTRISLKTRLPGGHPAEPEALGIGPSTPTIFSFFKLL